MTRALKAMILALSMPVVDSFASSASLADVRALADSADQAVSLLPALALAAITILGLALWAVGGRFVKPSVVLVASAAGGYAGFTLGESFDPALGPWIGMALGITAGVLIGVWLFRMAAGVLLAAFLAVAAPTATAVAVDYDLAERTQALVEVVRDAATGGSDEAGERSHADDEAPRALVEQSDAETQDEPVTTRGVLQRAGAWMAGFLTDAAEGGEDIWDDLEPKEQRTIVAAGVIGALAGLVIGTIFPVLAMAVLTSGLGAAAMLGAGSNLALHFRPEWEGSFPSSPIAWAAIWVSVAFFGVVLQIAPHRKRRKKKTADDSPDDDE
jgi:hypothetical protein